MHKKQDMIMKRYRYYMLALLATAAGLFPSCSDDDVVVTDNESNTERLFMPMFRHAQNVGGDKEVPYNCGRADRFPDITGSSHVNDIILYWTGVNGASGYRIKAKIQGTEWDRDEVLDTIVGPEVLELLHEDLQYSTGYHYAIQALSPRGEAYNSKWYGYGDSAHQDDQSRDSNASSGDDNYGALNTGERYEIPSLFWVENVTKQTMRVCFNADAEGNYPGFVEAGGTVEDGKWVFDEIKIEPSSDNPGLPVLSHKMTAEDLSRGYVDFEGLESNAAYIVNGFNNKVKRYFDRPYNATMVRMQGDAGEPVKIAWDVSQRDTILEQAFCPDLQACRIDTVLMNYMSDNSIAEGQIFYLEGGKTYYTQMNVELTKGLTLETDPADLAAGKGRATVLLGVGVTSESGIAGNSNNFMLGRNAKSTAENGVSLALQPMIFNEINFSVHRYYNYMDKNGTGGNSDLSITANYFMNMYSQGLSFSLTELRITNCSFSGMVRGFIRFQGPNRQLIERLTVEGCVFYDCGAYDANGRGYAWFAGPGNNRNSNFYQNLTIRNNTFVDCPRHALVSENKNLAWPAGATWNIVIENNTFINFSTRSSNKGHGRVLEIEYPPLGSKIAFRKNLFVQVRQNDSDDRALYMNGMYISAKNLTYDFADNYATCVPAWGKYKSSTDPKSTLIDGLFTVNAFSNSTTGAGYQNGLLNLGGEGETRIKFGDNRNENEADAVGYQLTAEELFKNPAPRAANGHKDMHRYDVDGFYYNLTPRVMSHPIYTKKIGDQRWATGDAWK